MTCTRTPRRWVDELVTAAVAKAYLFGVSTRHVEDLVRVSGTGKLWTSQGSQRSQGFDGVVRSLPDQLPSGPCKCVWRDVLEVKSREDDPPPGASPCLMPAERVFRRVRSA
jgi:transposase-like protein